MENQLSVIKRNEQKRTLEAYSFREIYNMLRDYLSQAFRDEFIHEAGISKHVWFNYISGRTQPLPPVKREFIDHITRFIPSETIDRAIIEFKHLNE